MHSVITSTCSLAFALGLHVVAVAEECPGNATAIGTSRVIEVDPARLPRIGTQQFPSTLPLNDHEVVLSFDDGPLPAQSNKILDELAAECVKANFFVLGEMANDSPQVVRREKYEGHTVGTHTQTHAHLGQLSFFDAQKEVEQGIASAVLALGVSHALAPFFRAPYFETTRELDNYFVSRGLMLWSVDFDSDDWMDISPEELVARALQRVEQKGKGVLLLHDIQERTAVALPMLLSELKRRGYKIVHVVPTEPLAVTPPLTVGERSASTPGYPAVSQDVPASPISQDSCGNNPTALGTSRVIRIDPSKIPQVGTVQFPETLPLDDHELVLTFDDGPLPPFTDRILDTLASQCIKATFFVVGTMVNDSPSLVRREYDEGHTIGTLTQDHSNLSELPTSEAQKEIESGIASAKAALGESRLLAHFFRDPYLQTTSSVERYLRSQHITTWSIDFQADDWTDISPDEVVAHALNEIEQKRKGILELYDIQERTTLALPKLLSELKQRGYRIVHVAPSDPTAAGP